MNIAVFASGSGSNAENIIHYFSKNEMVKIAVIFTNNKNAFVIERAKKLNIPCEILPKDDWQNEKKVLDLLAAYHTDFIVLAGFLLKIPSYLIKKYPDKIINIHPALLPKYGGKGMYGENVHKAVIANREKESGISIHYVNENYDEGAVIFQAKCTISNDDDAETLAKKIHKLEYKYFPAIIEKALQKTI